MLDLDQITARAKDAPRQTTDVEVLFDPGLTGQLEQLRAQRSDIRATLADLEQALAAELEELDKDRRAGDGRPAAAQTRHDEARAPLDQQLEQLEQELDAVRAQATEFLVTFRFEALHGFEWADLCAHSTPRQGVAEDAGRAYNLDEVTKVAAARSGSRIIDGQPVDVTAEQWAKVWETLPAPGLQAIKMAVWYLNEYAWVQARDEAVVAARKVSTAPPAAPQP